MTKTSSKASSPDTFSTYLRAVMASGLDAQKIDRLAARGAGHDEDPDETREGVLARRLQQACENGRVDSFKAALSDGAKIDARAMSIAALSGRVDIARLCLKAGMKPTRADLSAAVCAVNRRQFFANGFAHGDAIFEGYKTLPREEAAATVKLLIDAGAATREPPAPVVHRLPLTEAASADDAALCAMLMLSGAEPTRTRIKACLASTRAPVPRRFSPPATWLANSPGRPRNRPPMTPRTRRRKKPSCGAEIGARGRHFPS